MTSISDTERESLLKTMVDRAAAAGSEPDIEAMLALVDLLPESDSEPLESFWHVAGMNLLIETLSHHWRDRKDFFCGGNMFVYYSVQKLLTQDFRGPDFFVVRDVERKSRAKWVTWDEDGKFPDLIIELSSPSTASIDHGPKKDLYERTFRTSEYFIYDPRDNQLKGWQLHGREYVAILPTEAGWLWSDELRLFLGPWTGEVHGYPDTFLRFFGPGEDLILRPTEDEAMRAAKEKQRADEEAEHAKIQQQRAESLEEEVERLRARLAEIEDRTD